jgi:hypothetical protein
MRLAHIARATARATQINPFFDPEVPRPRPRGAFNLRAASRRRHGGSLTRSTRRVTQAKLDKMLLKYAHDILDKTPEDVKLRTMGPSGA